MSTTETTAQQSELTPLLQDAHTESGRSLLDLVDERPILLVFLRHFGCSFCRQTLDDVSKIHSELDRRGVQVVFVHLGTPERAKPFFDHYHLSSVERISDPEGRLYAAPAFKLARVSLFQLIRPAVWIAWIRGAVAAHGIGLIKEDMQQMPGVFFLRNRRIANLFRHRTIADRPNYLALLS
ncbi:peroxiredoxin [Silvibacterium bohemicum]|uniref:Peroxiredoxin n=1 Tax=Silvibacterium bohemicum TaxID=1577686 RepID=A0A841JYU7_9BACT|nr:SelL-related redox protein [Silvibacterium bohemicum]MBB6146532.1 peroxiredoxin [Silvibacterium bohemicum]